MRRMTAMIGDDGLSTGQVAQRLTADSVRAVRESIKQVER